MFGLFRRSTARNLTAEAVKAGLAGGDIVLVDVREPAETAVERIAGAVLMPLSTFDPGRLPDPAGRTLVFCCASGIRSAKAVEIAQAAGLTCDAHLAGGLSAWKSAGYPTER